MGLHLIKVLLAAQPTRRVAIQQLRDYVLEFITHENFVLYRVWEYDSTSSYENAKLVMTLIHKRRSSCGHLVEQNPKCPPIDRKAMSFHIKYLWG